MDRLSSCYFCGTALDDPLQDYPLVAGDTGEYGAVVTLCPGCHHKLETVLDVVVGEGETPALEEADRAALEGESPAALAEPEDGSAVDPIALGDGQPGEGDPASGDMEDDGAGVEGEESGTDADSVETITVTTEHDDTHPSESQAATDAGDGPGADRAGEPAGGQEATDGASSDSTDGDSGNGEGTAGEQSGGTSPDREVTADVTALEYNKVIRLLQNREFPVERAEIETVAASAYELSEGDCAAVIDLAVDRGLVAERDGRLVKPE